MYKPLITGALLLLFTSGVSAAQDPAKIYGPTLNEYAKITCELQKTSMGHNYQWMQLEQAKLMGSLQLQTGKLTPAQRLQYNSAYAKAMNCIQPKNKPLTAEQYSKLGCKNSTVSTEQYLAATASDSKMLQALGKTKGAKNMYEKELARQMQHRKEQLELNGGGYDPCKKYDPYANIPD